MKKTIILAFVMLTIKICSAQVVGTPYLTAPSHLQRLVLDQLGVPTSFAFSTRKLREDYTGPALRLRRAADNTQVDVAFDATGVVSGSSIVTLVNAGTSGLALGTTATLAAFMGPNVLTVTIWYDQGTNGYHGTQNTISRQPVFSLGVAGSTNQYASLVFTGTSKHNVTVNQTIPVLLGSGLRGSVMMIARIQASTVSNNSWGHSQMGDNNIRWSAHMNWTDNNMYTDLGTASDIGRSFLNNATIGLGVYKQYTIVRTTTGKVVRTSGLTRVSTNLNTTSQTWSAGSTFGVGITTGDLDINFGQNGFTGNIPEFILFPEPLTAAQYGLLENNQILFWGSF